jgi:hypothetical protein
MKQQKYISLETLLSKPFLVQMFLEKVSAKRLGSE